MSIVSSSFDTIVGIGANSAKLHHSASNKMTRGIGSNKHGNIVLIDSGSQYYVGATDIKRTVNVMPSSDHVKKYTLVLKATLYAKMLLRCNPSGCDIDEAERSILNEETLTIIPLQNRELVQYYS